MYKYYNEVNILIEEMLNEYSIVKKSKAFYKGRIQAFFNIHMDIEINQNRPLNALTFYDIDAYIDSLECSDSEKLNIYFSLKRFFLYTYRRGLTTYFMQDVRKPEVKVEDIEYIEDIDYEKLRTFIFSDNEPINERLLLGLFLFTGLGRMYIHNIHSDDFLLSEGLYRLKIWKSDEEVILPVKAELQIIIHDYLKGNAKEPIHRIADVNENYLSTYISNITKRITGRSYTPTHFSSSFIKNALIGGNYIWEISNLTLESISTIEKHITEKKNLETKQLSILNSF